MGALIQYVLMKRETLDIETDSAQGADDVKKHSENAM